MFLMKNAEKIKKLSITMEDFININEKIRDSISDCKNPNKLHNSQVIDYHKHSVTPQLIQNAKTKRKTEYSMNKALKQNLSLLKEIENQLFVDTKDYNVKLSSDIS